MSGLTIDHRNVCTGRWTGIHLDKECLGCERRRLTTAGEIYVDPPARTGDECVSRVPRLKYDSTANNAKQ